jgi:hypothetical protein
VNRYTFVIQVHDSGPSTLENLTTHERIQVVDFAVIGPQIERWVAALSASSPPIGSTTETEAGRPGPPP